MNQWRMVGAGASLSGAGVGKSGGVLWVASLSGVTVFLTSLINYFQHTHHSFVYNYALC